MSIKFFFRRILRFLVLAAAGVGLQACSCTIARPFEGPGFDSDRGVTLKGVGDNVIVGLTTASVKDGDDHDLFYARVDDVTESLDAQDGFIGYSIRRTLDGSQAWTMTVWRDEEALWAFVASPVHAKAIDDAYDTMKSSTFATIEVPTKDLPLSWDKALELLAKQGRTYGEAP